MAAAKRETFHRLSEDADKITGNKSIARGLKNNGNQIH